MPKAHKKSHNGDVMRTPSINDLSARFLCNLPAPVKELPREGAQPAIGQRNVLGFLIVIDESPNRTVAAIGAALEAPCVSMIVF